MTLNNALGSRIFFKFHFFILLIDGSIDDGPLCGSFLTPNIQRIEKYSPQPATVKTLLACPGVRSRTAQSINM